MVGDGRGDELRLLDVCEVGRARHDEETSVRDVLGDGPQGFRSGRRVIVAGDGQVGAMIIPSPVVTTWWTATAGIS